MGFDEHACTYCDGNMLGLMIYCERCLTWYHYNCVNKKWDLPLRRKDLNYLDEYYCYPCRRANPELKIKYYSSGNYRRPLDDSNKEEGKEDENEANRLTIDQANHKETDFSTNNKVPAISPSKTSSDSSQLSSDSFSSSISSSTKFDEAIENKHPNKSTCKHDSSSCTTESSHTVSSKHDDPNHHHQHQNHEHEQQQERQQQRQQQQQQQQGQQNSQGQPETFKNGTDDKKSSSSTKQFRRKPCKGNRAKLRSKLDAIRRQKRSSKVYIKPKLL